MIDKTFKGEFTLGVTSVAVNDEEALIRGVIRISTSSALRDEDLLHPLDRMLVITPALCCEALAPMGTLW